MNFKNAIFFSGMAVLLSLLILNVSNMTYQSSFAATIEYEHKMKWGSKGFANGQFNQASGITADSENNVYVADF